MHEVVENILKTWATQKRERVCADFEYQQTQQRVWNILTIELDRERDRESQKQHQTAITWQRMGFWRILTPIAVGVAALVIVVFSSSLGENPSTIGTLLTQTTGEPRQILGQQPIDRDREESRVSIEDRSQENRTQETTMQQPRKVAERKKLYARRDQVVFVAWARSVYTPGSNPEPAAQPRNAPNVFSF